MTRKAISKKTRFEVFKRDGFKCQYCGMSAPDVVLHVDHIHPISKGGDNDVMNLITSCVSCNLGKSDRLLDDNSTIEKQKKQLEELSERREQLTMMLQWREGLKNIENDCLDAVVDAIDEQLKPLDCSLNNVGVSDVRKWLKRYSALELMGAAELAGSQYSDPNKLIEMIPRIACNLRRPEIDRKLYYIRGILKRRVSYVNDVRCIELMKEALASGCSVDELELCSKRVRSWTQFTNEIQEMVNGPR